MDKNGGDKEGLTTQESEWKIELSKENLVNYSDPSGNVLSYQLIDGVNTTLTFSRQLLEKRKHFKFREDDVYLPGFPRTGTNWTNEIAKMLVRGKAEYTPAKVHLELSTDEELEALESPRIINAHTRMTEAPEDLKVKKIKTIFTLRDPRDVAVSIYKITAGMPWSENPYSGSFADYLHLFLTGKVDYNGLFSHWRAAEKFFDENPDCPVHYQIYEETIQDPVGSVQRLSDFLGLKRDDKLCQDIADKCEFPKLKASKDKITVKIKGEDIIFRQGKSGDWRNYFTEELLDKYYQAYDEAMAGWKFYSLYARKK